MSILVNVVGQKMLVSSGMENVVAGSQKFVKFRFNLSEEWDGLLVFAQFTQHGKAYNQYLDEENVAYLPPEIGAGIFNVMLYGSRDVVIGTTNYLTFKAHENILISDASSTDISASLYSQLVAQVAAHKDSIDDEVIRATQAEAALDRRIMAKANQAQVDDLSLRVSTLANDAV